MRTNDIEKKGEMTKNIYKIIYTNILLIVNKFESRIFPIRIFHIFFILHKNLFIYFKARKFIDCFFLFFFGFLIFSSSWIWHAFIACFSFQSATFFKLWIRLRCNAILLPIQETTHMDLYEGLSIFCTICFLWCCGIIATQIIFCFTVSLPFILCGLCLSWYISYHETWYNRFLQEKD